MRRWRKLISVIMLMVMLGTLIPSGALAAEAPTGSTETETAAVEEPQETNAGETIQAEPEADETESAAEGVSVVENAAEADSTAMNTQEEENTEDAPVGETSVEVAPVEEAVRKEAKEAGPVGLEPYINEIILKYKDPGASAWKDYNDENDPLDNGDDVHITVKYSIEEGKIYCNTDEEGNITEESRTVTYNLPSVVKVSKAIDGVVSDSSGNAVGTLHIGTDGATTIVETNATGFIVTKSGDTGIIEDGETASALFTNSRDLTSATVKKVWDDADDQDGIRPKSLTVTLNKKIGAVTTEVQEVTLPVDGIWEATVSNLPKDEDGKAITYTWSEKNVPTGYTLTGNSTNGTITTLTNSHTPEETEATVKKVWNDKENQDGKRPASLEVTLSNGTKVTLNKDNNWTATVKKLPKYNKGTEIVYTWKEGTMPEGYSYTPDETEATVKKVWNDADNQDGKRPAELKVTLSNGTEVTLNEANNWTATVKKLPKYEKGEEIVYTWTENEKGLPKGYNISNPI